MQCPCARMDMERSPNASDAGSTPVKGTINTISRG